MSKPKPDTAHSIDILEALHAGRLALDVRPPDESGALHASSVPAIADGIVYAGGKQCPRMAWLRWTGVDIPAEFNRILMFGLGHQNEEIVAKELEAARIAHLREDATGCAISWTAPGGVRVTGRPDFLILGDAAGWSKRPTLGIELKAVCSLWTMHKVHYALVPTSEHLIQAAHYSWQHGMLPWTILYTSRVDWHLSTAPAWLQKKFPPGAYDVEVGNDGKPFKIVPFERTYRLAWRPAPGSTELDDRATLVYWTEGLTDVVPTRITPRSIQDGAALVGKLFSPRVGLGPRPSAIHVDGGDSYSPCKYCDLAEVCDQYESSPEVWKDQATIKIAEIRAERRPGQIKE